MFAIFCYHSGQLTHRTADKTNPLAIPPKMFVSYSWTNSDHEAWVLGLATELRESGVNVILDKWDLKEGNDAHVFMEKMVTDPDIKKVILICDKLYAEKTDGRSGGVSKEAQIISGEIYEKQDQDKFGAVVKERDENGKPHLPVYYRSRIYIDLSDAASYSENFERLLRWAFDQPLFKKPDIGSKPRFLTREEDSALSLATSSVHRRALDAVKAGRGHAIPAIADYFDLLAKEFEKLRLKGNPDPFDDAVIKSIESFLPYRDQAIEMFINLAIYLDTQESRTVVHRFFEQIIPFMDCPQDVNQWRDTDWDNFRFIIHELFLYAVAILIQRERFEAASQLMITHYYIPGRHRFGHDPMCSFETIRKYAQSFEIRNQRLQLQRLSVRGDLLRQRCKGVGIDFHYLMQADFILFMRSRMASSKVEGTWFPETLVHVGHQIGPFEVFVRSRSASYFIQAKILLGIAKPEELKPVLDSFKKNPLHFPRWQFNTFNPTNLMDLDKLATLP